MRTIPEGKSYLARIPLSRKGQVSARITILAWYAFLPQTQLSVGGHAQPRGRSIVGIIDWAVLALYFIALIGLSVWIGARQRTGDDYFLGGRKLGGGIIALSLAANQVSAVSLIGAPAFVALRPGGGMRWLQYEFAVPLAMIAIIFILVPLFRRMSGATVFEYLEDRFGPALRLSLAAVFLVSRGLATGVVLYASAVALAVTLAIPLTTTLLVMGIIAIAYTTIGGITADIISDAFQLVILFLGTLACLFIAMSMAGGPQMVFDAMPAERQATIITGHHGLGDGHDFGLWPMLIGGFFLYVSYYGCDQSQAQRLMSAGTRRAAQNSLMVNGLIRFPVVLAYCLLGAALSAFITANPQWITAHGIDADPNLLVPTFIVQFLPTGLMGLVMAGIFAATMSSIDSNLNSLSAVTMHDFIANHFPRIKSDQGRFLLYSRLVTALWGVFCITSGYAIAESSRTVIELVNMIGSAFYGPILAVFLLGAFTRSVGGSAAILGLGAGLTANLLTALLLPGVSWLWWNPLGCLVTLAVAFAAQPLLPPNNPGRALWTLRSVLSTRPLERMWLLDARTWILVGAFAVIIAITALLGS